ncbi:endospore germination permease [Paenibacillus sp. PR3]|uniref:Endospore germination permease n=1 Tax=Paenibacillus terricola TaxID=2763503 RepID=A0ABR8MZS5_9BACL|nr:endospore germination permease [Paenibacillus terricola]MBD3921458.1 endospore germination permease [Paenibacillus terricola]
MQAMKRFGLWPMIMMMTLSVGIVNHVVIIPLLLKSAHRDAWLSVLVSLPAAALWAAFPLMGIVRSIKERSFNDWLDARVPSVTKWLVNAIIFSMLIFTCYHSLVDTVAFSNSTYVPLTPSYVVTFLFIALCAYGALAGLRTIAFISCILLPIVIFLGDFVMSANIRHKDYHFMLPIAEHGFSSILDGGLYAFSALLELYMLMLIQPHLKGQMSRGGIVILIAFLAMLALGPATGAIAEFGPFESERLKYPAFSQWRLVTIGHYIEHLDFLAIYQWMAGSFVRISLTLYLASELLFRTNKSRNNGIIGLSLLVGYAAYYTVERQLYYRGMLQDYFHYSGIVVLFLTLMLWAIAAASGADGKETEGGGKRDRHG